MDFVLVDGTFRDYCALKALKVVRPGGMLIIDNAHRFLPHPPWTDDTGEPPDAIWKQVQLSLKDWRQIWADFGRSSTAFFFKPRTPPSVHDPKSHTDDTASQ